MKIVTFTATEPDAPGGQGLALILHEGAFHPVVIRAATAEDARANAETWWAEELAGAKGKVARAARRKAARAAEAPTSPPIPIPAPIMAAPEVEEEEEGF